MRTKLALKNTITSIILQLVLALSGFIIPKFFTEVFGSPMNGLVNSISQFISYINLVEAGISASVIVSLYAPIAEERENDINRILSATKKFYIRSGLAFAGLVGVLIALYPVFVKSEITDTGLIRMMIFVLSISGLVDYFFLGKYRVLLQADQRSYVLYTAQIIGTVIMTVVSIWQIQNGCSALVVKGTVAVIYILRSVIVIVYARRRYKFLSFKEEPDNSALGQRWSALVHQIAGMISSNTDMILLTVLSKTNALLQVSIYSTYNLVGYALTSTMTAFTNGLTAGFGQVMSQHEDETVKRNFSSYEYVYFILVFVAYTCTAVLLYPFIVLYTAKYDTPGEYLRWSYVILFAVSGIIMSLRQPGMTMICAAGHYKKTQNRAIIEAVINIVVSVALIRPLGINGVLLGTVAAFLYRTTDTIIYNNKYLVPGTLKNTVLRLIRNTVVSVGVAVLGIKFMPANPDNWFVWVVESVAFGIICVVAILGVNLIFEKDEFVRFVKKIFSTFKAKAA